MQIVTCEIENDFGTVVYITAVPDGGCETSQQWNELFKGIRKVLDDTGARILQERIFGTDDALRCVSPIRSEIYGNIDDGVSPSLLMVPEGIRGKIAGVQVCAVKAKQAPKAIGLNGANYGRVFEANGQKILTLSGLSFPDDKTCADQMNNIFNQAERLLENHGTDFASVARTWMWLGDILGWYDDFNKTRSSFFIQRGLIGKGISSKMPASTGIGIGPDNGGKCSVDLISIFGNGVEIEYLDAAKMQHCAYNYGSAFARATRVNSVIGDTIFVSGTASIDRNGETIHTGDVDAQIQESIGNSVSVLGEMGCGPENIVQSIFYCKTGEIEKQLHEKLGRLSWPWFSTIADICREDLLIEVEVTAVVQS